VKWKQLTSKELRIWCRTSVCAGSPEVRGHRG